LPSPVYSYLSDVEIMFHDDFNELSTDRWEYDEGYAKLSGGGWELTGYYNGFSRAEQWVAGRGALMRFKYEDDAACGLAISAGEWDTSTWRVWGIDRGVGRLQEMWTSHAAGDSKNEDVVLETMPARPDTWYYHLLAISSDTAFLSVVWEEGNPNNRMTAIYLPEDKSLWAGRSWIYGMTAYGGTVYADEYFELTFSGFR
jgi:hypothetical protein